LTLYRTRGIIEITKEKGTPNGARENTMTAEEAKKRLGLKENDSIVESGVKSVIKTLELQLKRAQSYERQNLKLDLEACKTLLETIKKEA
jgi:hypothetical protein